VEALAERGQASDPPDEEPEVQPPPEPEVRTEYRVPEEVQTELEALKARAERQDAVIRRLAAEPKHKGKGFAQLALDPQQTTDAAQQWKQAREVARESGCSALSAVLTDKVIDDLCSGKHGYQNPDGSYMDAGEARSKMEVGLKSVINAALADGLTTNPFEDAGWVR
jgi:hypothetical protein